MGRAVYHGTPQTNVHVCKHNRRGPLTPGATKKKKEMIPMTHPEAAFVSFWCVNRIGCVCGLRNSLGRDEFFDMKTRMKKGKKKKNEEKQMRVMTLEAHRQEYMCAHADLLHDFDCSSHQLISLIMRRIFCRIAATFFNPATTCICRVIQNFFNLPPCLNERIGFIISELRNAEKYNCIVRYVGSNKNSWKSDIFVLNTISLRNFFRFDLS